MRWFSHLGPPFKVPDVGSWGAWVSWIAGGVLFLRSYAGVSLGTGPAKQGVMGPADSKIVVCGFWVSGLLLRMGIRAGF